MITLYYIVISPEYLMGITTIRLQSDVEEGLQAVAETTQRSKNWLINQAVKEYVERQALSQQRWDETMRAVESVALGKVVDGDKVHAWLETWGTEKELPPPEVGK
jgi:predicted transcriptional regulator